MPRIQPRVCGDYRAGGMSLRVMADTTPRMRGLPVSRRGQLTPRRYNPAYAGTTMTHSVFPRYLAIQPRVCGDYMRSEMRSWRVADTTPRMRGLLFQLIKCIIQLRYNPAYAGTTVENI